MTQTTVAPAQVLGRDIAHVTTSDVARVYTGRPGCGCGCRGSYSDKPAQITRVLNAMKARADEVKYDGDPAFNNHGIFALEDETRFRWVYLKAQ